MHFQLPIDDALIDCRVEGDGFPLVLLHGNGEDHHVFDGIRPYLLHHFRIISIDMRGHGKSDFGTSPLTFSLFASDVIFVLKHLMIEKAGFLGYSDGANTVLQIATEYPQIFAFAIANAGNLYPGGLKLLSRLSVQLRFMIDSVCAVFSESAKQHKKLVALMSKQPQIDPRQLRKIEFPVLVVVGDHDVIRVSHTKLIADSIPHAELKVIRAARHDNMIAQPEKFYDEIASFLLSQKEKMDEG